MWSFKKVHTVGWQLGLVLLDLFFLEDLYGKIQLVLIQKKNSLVNPTDIK